MAKVDRAIYSNRQLEAVMEDFWFNHFNVFANKGDDKWLLTSYVRDTIRPHTMGKFRRFAAGHRQKPRDAFLPRQLFERRSRGRRQQPARLKAMRRARFQGGFAGGSMPDSRNFSGPGSKLPQTAHPNGPLPSPPKKTRDAA